MTRRPLLVLAVMFVVALNLLPKAIGTDIPKAATQVLARPPGSNSLHASPTITPIWRAAQSASSNSQNASIFGPVPPPAPTSSTTFKNGVVIPVTGTATGTGFQGFQVDWAPGLDPLLGWQTTGITLAGAGSAPVTSGPLATWDTSSVTAAGYYTIRLTVNISGTPTQALTMVYLEPGLLSSNWPQLLNQGAYFSAGVVPALNSDGTFRLVVESPAAPGPFKGEFFSLSLDGTQSQDELLGFGSFQQPAVADFQGTGSDQAVFPDERYFFVLDQNNSGPLLVNIPALDYTRNQILMEDLLGDSHREVVALGSDYTDQVAYVCAWNSSGNNISANFPIQIQDQNPVSTWYNRNRVLVGDVNGDGKKEIVVQEGLSSATFSLDLFANDGTPITWSAPILTGMPEAMAAADLDHNGKLETILVLYAGTSYNQSIVHVFQPDGTERPGWPVTLPNPDQYSQSFLAVGDLLQNGHYEIVYSHEASLYVLNADGTPLSSAWPLSAGPNVNSGFGTVVIGDVDGDGIPEIVTTLNTAESTTDPFFSNGSRYYDEQLLAIRADGTISKQWQLTGANGYNLYDYPAPAIGDFNQDGLTEIAVAYEVTGSPTSVPGIVTVLSTGSKFNPGVNDWPLTHHDPRNTSVLRCSDFCLSASPAQPVTAGSPATSTITITPNEIPYNFAIKNFTCSGLPTGAACEFASQTVTPGISTASLMLTINTTSRTLAMARPATASRRFFFATLLGAGFFGVLTILPVPPKRSLSLTALAFCLLLIGSTFAVGCGGSGFSGPHPNPNGTPAGAYTVTVSATGQSNITKTATVTLTVN